MNQNNTALQPINFYDDTIFVVDHHGEPFIPVRPLCENMGLDWKSQHAKIMARPERLTVVLITTVAQDGKQREMICIHLKKLAAWLYSIDPKRVAPHLKEKIEIYQDECDKVLPSIRKTGAYIPEHVFEEIVTKVVQAARPLLAKQQPSGNFIDTSSVVTFLDWLPHKLQANSFCTKEDRYGLQSSKELGPRQLADLYSFFRSLGWKVKRAKRNSKASPKYKNPEHRKVVALWITLANAGVVKNRSDKALQAYVKRMTGVDNLRWCNNADCRKLIESLKQWTKREKIDV